LAISQSLDRWGFAPGTLQRENAVIVTTAMQVTLNEH